MSKRIDGYGKPLDQCFEINQLALKNHIEWKLKGYN